MSNDPDAPQRFAYVDPNTGMISATGSLPAKDVDRQNAPAGQVVMTVAPDVRSGSHKMDLNGLDAYPGAVRLTKQELDDRLANDPVTKYLAAQAAAAPAAP